MKHTEVPDIMTTMKVPDQNGTSRLEAGDKVIYAAIRRSMDSQTRQCWPSIATLKERAGCSQDKITAAIKRLKESHLIEVSIFQNPVTGRWSNLYKFPKSDFDNKFERFTDEFLDMDLPTNVKEYYMDIQQFLRECDTGKGKCWYSNSQLAKLTGRNVKSVKKYNTILIEKGYLEETVMENQTDDFGLPVVMKTFDLESMNQAQLWVKKVNETLDKNTEDIEDIRKELAELKEWKAKKEREEALKRNNVPESQEFSF